MPMSRVSRLPVALMAAGALVLVALILAAAWLASVTADMSARVVAAREIRISASEVLETLLNAETGQRGFLLTGASRYLEPFASAETTIKRDLDKLTRLERDNSATQADVARLRQAADSKMTELRQTIALFRQGHRDEALEIVRTDRGKVEMDTARNLLGDIIRNAEQIVSINLTALNNNARLLRAVAGIGGLVVMLFSGAALWLVLRAVDEAVRSREETESLNTALEERVLRRTEALTRANEEIQRFAYIVSHDLRAPLVNIMGFTSELEVANNTLSDYFLAEAEEKKPAAKEAAIRDMPEAVKFIRSSTGKMDRLINAILKLSREGGRQLLAESVDLNNVFQTIAESLKHQIEESSTTVELSARLPVVISDRLGVEQVFTNLFDNALKYLQPGRPGQISVHAENARNGVIISIKDNGRGIADNDRERIFELFRRAGRQDRPGEGIGLAHVRALVRRLGGDITVMSQVGVGSEFRVLLPHTLPAETGKHSA